MSHYQPSRRSEAYEDFIRSVTSPSGDNTPLPDEDLPEGVLGRAELDRLYDRIDRHHAKQRAEKRMNVLLDRFIDDEEDWDDEDARSENDWDTEDDDWDDDETADADGFWDGSEWIDV